MRTKAVRPTHFVSQLRCDRCGAEATYDVDEGFNNFLQIEFDAGWGSAIGDGTHVEVDLCHACLKQTLGQWLRLSPAAGNRLPDTDDLNTSDDVPFEDRRPSEGTT